MKKGKLIVFYGVNNLGKTTQARLVVDKLNKLGGHKAKYLKYPIYDLEPTGGRINNYLRSGNPENLTPKDAQILYAENRRHYEPILKADLEAGVDIVAEDYWGTGVAWGMGAGVEKAFLHELNSSFLKEDLALLFVGKRFTSGLEKNHRHETDDELTNKVEKALWELAAEFGWKEVKANQPIQDVSKQVWNYVAETFRFPALEV